MTTESFSGMPKPEVIYRLRLYGYEMTAIRSMAIEAIDRCMREGQEPDEALQDYATKSIPVFRFSSTEDINTLATRLDNYAAATESARLDIAMQPLPRALLEDAMTEREQIGQDAKELADHVRGLVDIQNDLDIVEQDPDAWLRNFTAA